MDAEIREKNEIKALDKGVIHRICTGQVILSLAAACKELIENALDAGATTITIRVKDHGLSLLEVIDNGCGIKEENFVTLGQAHCTSKLADFNDLASLATFGFRGEALNALMALSGTSGKGDMSLSVDLSLVTKHSNSTIAHKLDFDHTGGLTKKFSCYRTDGTTVSVSNFFTPLPVRRKEFETNAKKEFTKLTNLIYAYCIICTKTRFEVVHTLAGKRTTLVTTYGNATVKENLCNIYGGKLVENLLEFKSVPPTEESLNEFHLKNVENADLDMFTINGFVSTVQNGFNRNTDRQFIFINGRPCEYPKLCRLVNDVYHVYNLKQYPYSVINVWSKSDAIDVNVTPDKRSIFVSNESLLMAVLQSSLKSLYDNTAGVYEVNRPNAGNSKSTTSISIVNSFGTKRTASAVSDENRQSIDNGDHVVFKQSKLTDRFRTFLSEDISLTNKKLHVDCLSESEYSSSGRASSPKSATDSVRCDNGLLDDDNVESEPGYVLQFHHRKEQVQNLPSINEIKFDKIPEYGNELSEHFGGDDFIVNNCVQNVSQSYDGACSDVIEANRDNIMQIFNNNVNDQLLASENAPSVSEKKYGHVTGSFIVEAPQFGVVRRCRSIPFSLKSIRKRLSDLNHNDCANSSSGEVDKEEFHREFRARILPSENIAAEDELKRCVSKDMFKTMSVIGQFNRGFIITRLCSDLFIVDQHASDEKYNYETLKQDFFVETQRLIQYRPLPLELTSAVENVVLDNLKIFRKNGFEFELRDESPRLRLIAVPATQRETSSKEDIEDIAFVLTDFPGHMYRPPRIHKEMASKACRMSAMISHVLNCEEMKRIVCNMAEIEQPWNCPHGRPTMRHLFNLKMLPS